MSATTTYSAHVVPTETQVEVIIRRAIPAGIDGPFGGFVLTAGASMSDVSAELGRHGYAPVALDGWKVSVGYDGLRLDAELARA